MVLNQVLIVQSVPELVTVVPMCMSLSVVMMESPTFLPAERDALLT